MKLPWLNPAAKLDSAKTEPSKASPLKSSFTNIFELAKSTMQKQRINKDLDNMQKLPKGFDNYIEKIAEEISQEEGIQIESNLLRSVIKRESGFNPRARSRTGAVGLMQLMPHTATAMGVGDPYDPYDNIRGGAKYLARLMKRFNNVPNALAAYNAGPTAVSKYGGMPPFGETRYYVTTIMKEFALREGYKSLEQLG